MTRGILTLADLKLTSSDFVRDNPLPARFTIDGGNRAPELHWEGVGKTVVEFALICEDPDAPGGTFVHWVVYNIPGSARGLQTQLNRSAKISDGTKQGKNSFGRMGYDGPKPPKGKPHHYVFTLYSLDKPLILKEGATKEELLKVIEEQSNIVQTAQLIGTYQTK